MKNTNSDADPDTLKVRTERWLDMIDVLTDKMPYSERTKLKIASPGRDVLLEAVKTRQDFLMYLPEQADEDILLAAVNADGYAISQISKQSDAVKLASVKGQRGAIEYIDNPSVDVQVLALTHDMGEGYFDAENLAFFSDKFTDEALALVSPALVLLRQLYGDAEDDVNDLTAAYESFQPLNKKSIAQKLLPEDGLSSLPTAGQNTF